MIRLLTEEEYRRLVAAKARRKPSKHLPPYEQYVHETVDKVVKEVFKDYKDPTDGMTHEQAEEFHKAMKRHLSNE